ncbi:MAG: DUF3054 domain-containing protein [Actinomycetota bacterium]
MGDAAAIVFFVIIGLSNHDEGITLKGIARTALPILGAWFALAPFTKTYARPGLRSLLATWAFAVPVGVAIRAAFLRRSADASQFTFLVVAAIVTLALLFSWRALLALLERRMTSDVRR